MYKHLIELQRKTVGSGWRNNHFCQISLIFLILIPCFCQITVAEEGLSILLMPVEGLETTENTPFTQTNHPFGYLKFLNQSQDDWEKLKIGYHYWLCAELEKFAQAELKGGSLYVRFAAWENALNAPDALKNYDVIQVPSTWTAYFISEGALSKCKDPNMSVFLPELVKTCSIEGSNDIYAIPWQSDTRVLYYRKELTNNLDILKNYKDFVKCLENRKNTFKEIPPPEGWKAPFAVSVKRDWDHLHFLSYFFNLEF